MDLRYVFLILLGVGGLLLSGITEGNYSDACLLIGGVATLWACMVGLRNIKKDKGKHSE